MLHTCEAAGNVKAPSIELVAAKIILPSLCHPANKRIERIASTISAYSKRLLMIPPVLAIDSTLELIQRLISGEGRASYQSDPRQVATHVDWIAVAFRIHAVELRIGEKVSANPYGPTRGHI